MLIALVSLAPVALGLFLLTFGLPGRPFLEPVPRNLAAVGAAALLIGPVAQLVLGLTGWLVLIALLVTAVIAAAGLGGHRRRAWPR